MVAARFITLVSLILVGLVFGTTPARATLIVYDVDRSLPLIDISGTLTVETTTASVVDWDITLTSTSPALQVTLTSSNSSFFSIATALTPTATSLTIAVAVDGIFGPELRNQSIGLRHEWFLFEEEDLLKEQAFINFAGFGDPVASDQQAFSNPVVLQAAAIPEPSTLALFVLGLAGLGFMMQRRRSMYFKAA